MPVLVVVDMQPRFEASNCEQTINACATLIKRFRRKNWPIIILEYIGNGQSHQCLLDLIKGYRLGVVSEKNFDDGSSVIYDVCDTKQFDTDEFHVCGVNLGACVRSTISGMKNLFPKSGIHLYKNACNQPNTGFWASYTVEDELYKIRSWDVKISDVRITAKVAA